MGMFNEKWVSKCNPCRKCKNKPSVQSNGNTWIIYCHHCHPKGKGLTGISVFVSPYEAVRNWNYENYEDEIEYFSVVESLKESEQELHEQLARLYTFDVESIGSIDGTVFANRIKNIAENFAKSPIREGLATVPNVIHLLGGLIETMPEFKEEKHE